MKVLNLIWGFGIGGIGKCYETYAKLGQVDNRLQMVNACIYLKRCSTDRDVLERMGAHIIEVNGRCDISWIKRLNALIEKEQIDLIFTHGFNGPVVAMVCRWMGGKKVPIVCSYHGEYHPSTSARKFIAPIFNGAMHFIHKHFAVGVLTCADYCKRFLVDCGVPSEKVTVVHNGIVDLPISKIGDGKFAEFKRWVNGRTLVGIASRLDVVKGLDVLVLAMAKLKNKGRNDICAVMIGDGADMAMLRDMVKQHKLDQCIYFTGGRNDVRDWIQLMDVFALPSRFEYHSIGLLEAMRDAKAIVCSDVGGNCESVRNMEEGLVIRSDDVDGLSDAIEKMADNVELRNTLGRNARKRYLELFTEDKMESGIADMLTNMGGGGVFLIVSRLEKIKGLDAMICGFAKAKKLHNNIRLLVVGDGTEMQSLKNIALATGVGDSVQFVGYKEDVTPYYQMTDVYCLPSYSEAFSVSLLEAMRAGKPSIVSRVGGIPEAVSESEAVFIQPGDEDSIGDAICRLAGDDKLRDKLGKNARKRYVENFTEERMMQGIASWLIKIGGNYV